MIIHVLSLIPMFYGNIEIKETDNKHLILTMRNEAFSGITDIKVGGTWHIPKTNMDLLS